MQYRVMKTTGDKLSVLGFGCMRLPRKGLGIDEERSIKQIRYAIDRGVNYLDTALLYPGSEAVLGKALADGYRSKVFIATKVPFSQIKKAEDMDRLLNLQLQKLQTNHIDYYLLHNLNKAEWNKLKSLGIKDFIAEAKADGRVRHMGFSSHSSTAEVKDIIDDFNWEFCQIQYNYLDEQNQAGKESLQYAASKGLGVIIMEPLRGGNLTRLPPKEVRAIWDKADIKRTPAEWGLRWVWNHPEVTVVLSGMNDERHVEENLRIADEALPNSLSEKELALIGQVKDTYRRLMKVNCTGCRYCMPCPAGVDIPGSFDSYNNLYFGDPMWSKIMYHLNMGGGFTGTGKKSLASQCKGCGKCVRVCTQHIDIPAKLKEASKELESPGTRAIMFLARPLSRYYMRYERWIHKSKVKQNASGG